MSIVTGVSFLLGLALWTFLEYALHRWVFHARVLGRAAAREHLQHHARVSWFAPWSSKARLAAPVLVALIALGAWVGSGAALAAGTLVGWLVYELIHRRIHVAAPAHAYARWARRHHLAHHFGGQHRNFGVTSPLWDLVFGTLEQPARVRVPADAARALPWLAARAQAPWGLDYEVEEAPPAP